MSNKKTSELTEITSLTGDEFIEVLNPADTSMSASGSNNKIKASNVIKPTTITGDATGSGTGTVSVTVSKINGKAIDPTAPSANDVLFYNGSQWNHMQQTTLVAGSAPRLTTARNISGTSFDGQTDITIDHAGLSSVGTNTHAQIDTALARLANTSGTNTGDQVIPTDATLSVSDVTTNNVSITKHGFCPKAPNNSAQFLDGTGAWSTPAGAGNVSGPATNTDSYIPQWNGANSKVLKDGKVAPTGTIVGTTDTQDLSNKTLVTPWIHNTGGTFHYKTTVSAIAADRNVNLPLLTADDEFTFNGATQTLTNKTLTSPKLNEAVAVTTTATELNSLHGQMGAWTTWTPAFTGFSVNPTVTIARYIQIGKFCTAILNTTGGTSNATTFTVTLPVAAANITNYNCYVLGYGLNNSVAVNALVAATQNSAVATIYVAPGGGAWVNTGTKNVQFTITYETV